MGSSSFFSSSPSTFSPIHSPNSSYSIFQTKELNKRFQQHDYIKENLVQRKHDVTGESIAEEADSCEEADSGEEKCDYCDDTRNDANFLERHLIIYKAFYFLFYGAVGSLFPYLAVFYKQLYLSAQQVGFLIGVRPFIQMGTAPLWGAIADTYNVKKTILLMSIAAWLGTNYSISFVRIPPSIACASDESVIRLPPPGRIVATTNNLTIIQDSTQKRVQSILKNKNDDDKNEKTVGFIENIKARDVDRESYIAKVYPSRWRRNSHKVTSSRGALIKDKQVNFTAGDSNIPEVQRLLAADELEEEFDAFNTDGDYPWPLDTVESTEQKEMAKKNSSKIFIVLIIITIGGTILASPTATLADTATLENLDDNLHKYGFQRVWGALGWGLGAFIVGLVVSYIQRIDCQRGNHVDYILSFYVYAVMMAFAFVCAIFFMFKPIKNSTPYSQSLGEALKLFCDCQHISFVVTLLCSSASLGFIHTFLFWHLHDLGGTQTLFSVLTAVQCVSEVIMYFVSGYLLLKIGYDNVLYIGLASNVLRLFSYSIITGPFYSVPMEILQGVSSASIWTSAVCYIGLIPGAPVTLQALLHGIYWGLGHGGGGILGGVLVTYLGSTVTFLIYGSLCLVNLLFLLIFKYRSKLMELLCNYTYVENIPAGTYILTQMAQERPMDDEEVENGRHT